MGFAYISVRNVNFTKGEGMKRILVIISLSLISAVASADCTKEIKSQLDTSLLSQAVTAAQSSSEIDKNVENLTLAETVKQAYPEKLQALEFTPNGVEKKQGVKDFYKVSICYPKVACGNAVFVGVDASCKIMSIRADRT